MSVGATTGGSERAVVLRRATARPLNRRTGPALRVTASDPVWSAPNAAFAGRPTNAIRVLACTFRPPIPSTDGRTAERPSRLPAACRRVADRVSARIARMRSGGFPSDELRRSGCPVASLLGVPGAPLRTRSGLRPNFFKTVKLRIRTADQASGLRTCRSWIGSAGRASRVGTMVALAWVRRNECPPGWELETRSQSCTEQGLDHSSDENNNKERSN